MGCAPSVQKPTPSDIKQRKVEQVNSDNLGDSADNRSIEGMDNEGKPSNGHIFKDELVDEESESESDDTGVFHNKSKDEILQILKAISTTALTNEGLVNENGDFYIETSRAFDMYHEAFFLLNYDKGATKDDLEKLRGNIAQVSMDTKFFHAVADLTQTLYKRGSELTIEMFYCLFFTYCQSYNSVEFVEGVVRAPGFLETVKQILIDHKQEFLEEEYKVSILAQMAESCLGILDYVAMKDQVARLNDLDLLTTLTPYLGSAINKQRLMTLMVIAVIINEDECEILNTQPDIINYLINDAKVRLAANRKESGDFSCYECAFVIRQLARNDENKRILVQLGALPVLVRICDTAEEDKLEKYEVVHGIWALCFDKENAKLVSNNQELGVVELLLKLKNTEDDGIRKACNGALWTLQDALISSKVDFYREVGAKFEKENKKRRRKNKKKESEGQHKGGHIMISYQWANQQILKVVRDRVKANGFKVWMDIDEMGGSTLQAMAEAVENAAIILICMSQKYKNSSNCRAEAEYAFQKKKTIIPLKLERGYEPDGWLGFICGTKLFFEFTDKYPFEEKMNSLLKEIASVLKQSATEPNAKGDNIDGLIVPVLQQQTRAVPPVVARQPELFSGIVIPPVNSQSIIDNISKWSQAQYKDWINKHDLNGCDLDKMGGKEVAMLATMWLRAPEAFYKCLRVTMNISDLTSMAKLDYAVRVLVAPSTEDPSH